MAEAKHIAGAGIEHDASSWWCDTFRGTAEALIAAGLIRADELPGGAGVNKVQRTFLADGSELRKGQNYRTVPGVRRIVKRGRRFAVEIVVDEAERERRRAVMEARHEAEQDQRERERRIEEKAERARAAGMTLHDWVLRGTPSSEGEYRAGLVSEIGVVERIVGVAVDRGYGYALDAPTLARLRMLFEAMRSLIRQAPMSFDPAAREQAIDDCFEREGVPRHPAPKRPALRLIQ